MTDEELIKQAGKNKLFPSKLMRYDCRDEPTSQQIENFMRIAPGASERYERSKQYYGQQQNRIEDVASQEKPQQTSAKESVVIENAKGRIMMIVNALHGRGGYDYETVNAEYTKIFKRHGLKRSIEYWEKELDNYKKKSVEKHGEYLPPPSQKDDVRKVITSVELQMDDVFGYKNTQN